jgi:hypothetical protein
MKYSVRLIDNTVGTIDSDTINGLSAEDFIGKIVEVYLNDENGNPIEVRGKLAEVLEENLY